MKLPVFLIVFFLSITLHGQTLFFESGKSDLSVKSQSTLDSLVSSLSNSVYVLEIYGHCDSRGSEKDNRVLAKRRADAVLNYLQKIGVDTTYMVSLSEGETLPVGDNQTEMGRALNRRVEIKVSILLESSGDTEIFSRDEINIAPSDSLNNESQNKVFTYLDSNLTSQQLTHGKKMILKNLNFVPGEAELLPTSLPTLEILLKMMRDNPDMEIELMGHVCCHHNPKLSEKRAKVVYDYLKKNGISASRMKYAGYSNMYPLVPEVNEEARKMNRRVEVLIR